ncbi:MAG: pyruvate, phosphate dikinase [Actinomycetota bacterium]|nr:pyruvate, phosphate dikinase [Actinomycetota bacterium]
MASTKYVYDFDEGDAGMKKLLGGKGSNLAEMTRLGLPVPPGFTITTEACNHYYREGAYPEGLAEEIDEHLERLEKRMGKRLGDKDDPLLVSVRSGAAISMPGMMDTVLNLGLNDESVKGLAAQTGDERFAYDAYRRFIQMFSDIVMGVSREFFEEELNRKKEERGVKLDVELTAEDWKDLVEKFKAIVREKAGRDFPSDPREQLDLAIQAVFKSWGNPRAVTYRKQYDIPHDLGTAVNVQTMVFGNKGDDSATGVCFTRNPSTGEAKRFGEYLVNAQGEDVVAGIRTPKGLDELATEMPELYEQLTRVMDKLERHYRDMQDIEFTIEQGKLFMLQTRTGKRTAAAALKIAVDMVESGLIDRKEAVSRIQPDQLDQLLHPRLDPEAKYEVIAKGLPASPGAAVGEVVFDADTAEMRGSRGEKVILVRWETTPDDIHGIIAAQGVLTSHGGMTSHAAVVARGMGKPCICGAEAIKINQTERIFEVNGLVVREGETITLDGTSGKVILGEVKLIEPKVDENLEKVLSWADEIRRLGVRTNADTPEDARRARDFGAEGIGLCRIEHMLIGEDRLPIVRRMILAEDEEGREEALMELEPLLRRDFEEILEIMDGLPVTIRLLDPPLHEFLPNLVDLRVELERLKHVPGEREEYEEKEKLLARVRAESEANPMLGLRGCRVGCTMGGVTEMQVRAIIKAACDLKKKGKDPRVEIMIPLVAFRKELEIERQKAVAVAEGVIEAMQTKLDYLVGTMIELPRAALTADQIGEVADFFSFGTNDLTQTTLGFSRDDAEAKFLPVYIEEGILTDNPFQTLDVEGVGKLVRMACELGRGANPGIKLGICGEHGGDPRSIRFCHEVGLDYVSCSPFRVPVARLAAAHAALGDVQDATR